MVYEYLIFIPFHHFMLPWDKEMLIILLKNKKEHNAVGIYNLRQCRWMEKSFRGGKKTFFFKFESSRSFSLSPIRFIKFN